MTMKLAVGGVVGGLSRSVNLQAVLFMLKIIE